MNKLILIFLVITVVLASITCSCSLRRANPLDPENHPNISVPPQVTGLVPTTSGSGAVNKFVRLTWNRNIDNTEGYYMYMGLAYNSAYTRVGTLTNNTPTEPGGNTISWINNDMTPGDYYFKVSAYKSYGSSGKLEGPLSNFVYIRVPN